MPGHHNLACSSDGRFVVAFGITPKPENERFSPVQLFSASSGELLRQFECQDGEPHSVAISPTGETVAAIFASHSIAMFPHHDRGLYFSPAGATLVTGTYVPGEAKTMFLFSFHGGAVIEQRTWTNPESCSQPDYVFSPDGANIIIGLNGRPGPRLVSADLFTMLATLRR